MLDVESVAAQVFVEQLVLILVLETLLILVNPILGILAFNLRRHQSAEHGIAGKLGGGGDDAVVNSVLLGAQILLNGRLQVLPLVVAEIVYHNQKGRPVLLQQGEHLVPQHGGGEHRLVRGCGGAGQPVHIVLLVEFAELLVGLLLLRREDLVYIFVVGTAQLQIPVHQLAVQLLPTLVVQPA